VSSVMSGLMNEADRDVCFEVDSTATYGTLRVPAHRPGQRLAAALLLPGSGPVDRDGNVPSLGVTPQTLKLIAGALGELGIMTLRFDKYFTGRTGAGAYAADPGRIDLGAFGRPRPRIACSARSRKRERGRRSSPGTARVPCTPCSPRHRYGRIRPGSR
jgi:hypothetical protein